MLWCYDALLFLFWNLCDCHLVARCLSTMSWAVSINTCLGIASNIESTSLLCWPNGAGARHQRRMSTQVCSLYSLDEAGACWTFIPFELPIHPTAMAHGVSSLLPTSVKIWCSLIGAERPRNLGGTTAFGVDVGRIDPGRIDSGADRP